ncbi:hypothetical protein J6590_005189 [Homalodisca vitripennis]|nr:hypothetical protein J6590_005189 [Homalodisca vitripennis]
MNDGKIANESTVFRQVRRQTPEDASTINILLANICSDSRSVQSSSTASVEYRISELSGR